MATAVSLLRAFVRPVRLAGVIIMLALAGVAFAALADDAHGVLHTAKGDFVFSLEIADTPAAQEKGLMYRKSLAPNAGMLFDFHTTEPVSFWMKNTLIPLDMVFIAANGTVKSIHADARPLDTTPILSGVPVRFVLEIAGGRAAAIGLEPGDHFSGPRIKDTP